MSDNETTRPKATIMLPVRTAITDFMVSAPETCFKPLDGSSFEAFKRLIELHSQCFTDLSDELKESNA